MGYFKIPKTFFGTGKSDTIFMKVLGRKVRIFLFHLYKIQNFWKKNLARFQIMITLLSMKNFKFTKEQYSLKNRIPSLLFKRSEAKSTFLFKKNNINSCGACQSIMMEMRLFNNTIAASFGTCLHISPTKSIRQLFIITYIWIDLLLKDVMRYLHFQTVC